MTLSRKLIPFAAVLFLAASVFAQTPGSPGTVISTIDAGTYTYVEINIGSNTVWYAAPATELKSGEQVIAPAGMPMKNFYSKTLDRTFDMVYFVDSIPRVETSDQPTALPPGHPPIQFAASPSAASHDFSGIEKPEGGKTVGTVYKESADLAGKNVVVRGIAVKVVNGVMGKNWVHLQDGTGEAGSNDLTVTTTNAVDIGATVTATGVLATNLDFGYGYKYPVLLQDAAIK